MEPGATKYFSSKNLEYFQSNSKKKTLDLIKEYLSSQPQEIKKLESVSKCLNETMTEFIELTSNYSNQLAIIALKIIPTNTIEGQLAQAIQGILLFFSEDLNSLTTDLKNKNINKSYGNQFNDILKQFEEYNNNYSKKIKEAIFSSDKFRKEIDLYQEYLVNKEYNEHMSKGDKKNNDDDIISFPENNNENKIKEEKMNEQIEDNKINTIYENEEDNDEKKEINDFNNIDNNGLNNIDNEKEVIIAQQSFISNINESNDILNNIRAFLSKEKTNFRKNIFNICDSLIEGLLKFTQNQKKNYNTQNDVVKNLTNILQFEETEQKLIKPGAIKLKYLEIYRNYIKEKGEISNNKKSNLTTDDIKNKKAKNTYLTRKTFNPVKRNSLSRNTISFIEAESKLSKQEIYEKFKSMVIKLNRDEILKIFDSIKKTNIKLSESDIKLIEEETNYKTIHEILISIFINTDKYTEKEKNILINLFEKDKVYIYYFIRVLNDHRAKCNFILSENTLKYLGELFKFINNLILSRNELDLFKFIFILSMTYYHSSEKDNIKIYLFTYIKDHPDYQKVKFWEDYLNELIGYDLKENKNIDLNKSNLENLNKNEKEKLSNCYFSNFLTAVKAMADFRMDKKFVRDFVEKNKDKYLLSTEQINNICTIYELSLNENETNYNGDDIDKEKQNKSNEEKNKDNIKSENQEEKNNIDKEEKEENNIEHKEQHQNEIEEKILDKKENKEKVDIDNSKDIENKKEISNNDENIAKNVDDNNKNNTNNEGNI